MRYFDVMPVQNITGVWKMLYLCISLKSEKNKYHHPTQAGIHNARQKIKYFLFTYVRNQYGKYKVKLQARAMYQNVLVHLLVQMIYSYSCT